MCGSATTSAMSLTALSGIRSAASVLELVLGALREPGLHDRLDPALVGGLVEALLHRGDLRIVDQLGLAEDAAALGPQLLRVAAEEDMAVLAREQAVRAHERMVVAQRAGDLLVDRVADHRVLGQGQHRVLLGDVDELPGPGALGLAQRGDRAEGGVQRGGEVADDRPDARRRPIGVAVHRPQPAGRLPAVVVGGLARARAVLAEPGDRRVDERGVLLAQRLVAHAELVHRARAEVLDHDVRAPHQLAQELLALGRLEVERDAELVAVELGEEAAEAPVALADERREVPRVVGLVRVLDLDHGRAEVAEHHRAVRAGDDARDVQDGHPAQRPLPVRRAFDAVEDVGPVLLDGHGSTSTRTSSAEPQPGHRCSRTRTAALGRTRMPRPSRCSAAVCSRRTVPAVQSWPAPSAVSHSRQLQPSGPPATLRPGSTASSDVDDVLAEPRGRAARAGARAWPPRRPCRRRRPARRRRRWAPRAVMYPSRRSAATASGARSSGSP